mmetsp:Transcript_23433/g.40064  ORF Transcript_23433/g.40064 Transcript_23433/m.40064 type:complete len:267 (-) Transcript_23433:115-915(-)
MTEPKRKVVVTRSAGSGGRRQSALQYSHGDEGFWDKLNKLQKKYLPILSSFIENIELVIKEHGTTEQIQLIRTKLGRLNSMLLNIYGIHKFHKKMEILESIELQITRWISAWKLCAQDFAEKNQQLQNERGITTNTTDEESSKDETETKAKDTEKDLCSSTPDEESSEEESSGSTSCTSSSEDEVQTPIEIVPLGYDQLNELVYKFQRFAIGNLGETEITGNKRVRDRSNDRNLAHSLPVFASEEGDIRIGKKQLISVEDRDIPDL